ncbi:MAG: ADP-glyceromanno-heptose 6-epimerase [Candidatus Dadabacteria bacterium]|nr:MAG: ADP-glyceromanno-heptose 6-epimerase [Candidatus Dadabacteria bacterium]
MKDGAYVITGAAGFIGSAVLYRLNQEGIRNIFVVDELGKSEKWHNLKKREFIDYLHKDRFLSLIQTDSFPDKIKAIIHMGACSSTTEQDMDYLYQNNYLYSRSLAQFSLEFKIRFIYASSAATYGDGSLGYSDDDQDSLKLIPLNRYGFSKQLFDRWVIKNKLQNSVAGLKFFNVYGPNEYHKGEMRSVVLKAFEQIKETGRVKLFKSYQLEYRDGEQMRDFIYVKDCADVIWWLINNPRINGIFNLGTGTARTWLDLATAVFAAMGKKPKIDFIDMPSELRNQYQYFTEAKMDKLRSSGYERNFHSLEEGVLDYVKNYLMTSDRYL